MNHGMRYHPAVWIVFVLLFAGATASAEGIQLNRYAASETPEDGFYISRPNDQGHLRLGVSLHLDYANDPLVLETQQGERDSEVASVVAHQLASYFGLSLGLVERLVLFTGLRSNLLMKGEDWTDPETGETVNTADGAGLSDVTFGARARLLGTPEDRVGLALQATVVFPTGDAVKSGQSYAGEESVSFLPEILLEIRSRMLMVNLNLGTQIRKDVNLGTANVRDELTYGLGFLIPIVDTRLDGHVELFGATPFKDFGDRESTTLELLGGLKYYAGRRWALGLSGGMGLTRGVGSPDARVVAMVGWVMPEKAADPEPEPEGDRDGDGLLDSKDPCPDDPEDGDGFQDDDGCPDHDNDSDDVPDVVDSCPNDPEDVDDFEDDDGCVDPDNDQDGIADELDQCLNDAEDNDGFKDADGCPDPDNDNDKVPDADDECPLAPGVPEAKGCPKSVKLDISTGRIDILERVEFATGKDVILERSDAVLREVWAVVDANPQLGRVRIEGHTDDRGRGTKNMDLSKRRARSVKRWLVAQGIAAERLEAFGCGEALPVEDNKTRAGRQMNRRVEFHIVDPAPAEGPRAPTECEPSDE